MFGVPKHIAHKMVIKELSVAKRPLSIIKNLELALV